MTPFRDAREPEREPEPVTVRDKRRFRADGSPVLPADPVVRTPSVTVEPDDVLPPEQSGTSPAAPTGEPAEVAELRTQLGERTADLQRLKAEFDNYRRRVERDRTVSADQAAARVLLGIVPTLDDVARARQHGDVHGPFATVADSLETTVATLGLERFGEKGDSFDPSQHEAVAMTPVQGIEQAECVEVYRSGYRYAGRVLRAAQVVVGEPVDAPADAEDGSPEQADVQSHGAPAPGAPEGT